MILSKMDLENFKCFKKESISFGPLTLLAGVNGMGKSSVMQALLAARQTHMLGAGKSELLCKGPLVNLGLWTIYALKTRKPTTYWWP